MTGSLLMDFLIAIVGLALVVGLFFLAIDKIAQDDFFKKVARYAVGGAALIVFLLAVKGVLFGGGGGLVVTPMAVLQFAVALLVVVVVLYIVNLAVDFFAPTTWAATIKYVIGAIALIALLLFAGQVLFGGGVNMGRMRSSVDAPFRAVASAPAPALPATPA